MWTKQIPYLNALRQKAAASGEPLKFTASVWTPPGYMKSEGSTTGGYLLPSYYNEYAEYLMDFIDEFETQVGAPLYALSPQNEPGFCFGYNSSCSMPAEFSQEVKAVAAVFDQNSVATKIHYADIVWWPDWLGQCVRIIKDDPVANRACPILSIHYSDGNEAANLSGNQECSGYLDLVGRSTHRLWNTEFGGQYDSWTQTGAEGNAWEFANNLFTCLKYDYSAVIYWQLCEGHHDNVADDHYSLFYHNSNVPSPGPLFRVMQTFSRYIRPGAVRVGATSTDNNVWCIAFKHAVQQTVTVVMLNRNSSPVEAQVSGSGLPSQMNAYQTSPSQNCVNIGSVAPGATITLPVKSVTTLSNTPLPTSLQRPASVRTAVPATAALTAQVYRIDGRLLPAPENGRNLTGDNAAAPGIYYVGSDNGVKGRLKAAY